MVFNIYTVWDDAANEAGPLFQAKNNAVALRHFDQINEQIHKNTKGDYKLYYVGRFNTETMEILTLSESTEVIKETGEEALNG